MFVTIGTYLINAEQILHAYDTSDQINGGQVDGLRIEFIEHGYLFIPGATKAELEERLKAAAPF
jgi:hypothetical protein